MLRLRGRRWNQQVGAVSGSVHSGQVPGERGRGALSASSVSPDKHMIRSLRKSCQFSQIVAFITENITIPKRLEEVCNKMERLIFRV